MTCAHAPADAALAGPRHVLDRTSTAWPSRLDEVGAPPRKLFVVGSLDALKVGLAVIGARKATPYGRSCAARFARIAAEKGIPVISGGARGCDACAHEAALAAGGVTVAFLGGGCDRLYPPEHAGLFQRIVDAGGAVVSEHAWSTPPRPYAFRLRNRLIAGMAEAVLIVEAGLPSGTFSTADEALSAGRSVLVVPGSISSPASRGANRLLYEGAVPVVDDDTFEDQLFALFGALKTPSREASGTACASQAERARLEDDPFVAAVLAEPLTLEEACHVQAACGPDALRRALIVLAEAEQAGIVARRADGRWGARVRA